MSTQHSLLLFDCDGTLTNSHGIIVQAMQQAFQSVDLLPPDAVAVNRIIGLSLGNAVIGLLPAELHDDVQLHQHIEQAYRQRYLLAEHEVVLFPHVRETLEALRERGYWLGVVTGKSKQGLLRVLDNFHLADFFYVLRTADCTHSKPHPAMVLECMQEMGVKAVQTVVIGDALFDIQMAEAAGVRSLGVSFGVGETESLLQAGAEEVVNDFSELLQYFPLLQDLP
ncbi:MAG: HAD-IIIA family hydrolase [Mariprofundus sp.]|nr:HAD-IIIA family hydrolase [Mariprofundus sp.]